MSTEIIEECFNLGDYDLQASDPNKVKQCEEFIATQKKIEQGIRQYFQKMPAPKPAPARKLDENTLIEACFNMQTSDLNLIKQCEEFIAGQKKIEQEATKHRQKKPAPKPASTKVWPQGNLIPEADGSFRVTNKGNGACLYYSVTDAIRFSLDEQKNHLPQEVIQHIEQGEKEKLALVLRQRTQSILRDQVKLGNQQIISALLAATFEIYGNNGGEHKIDQYIHDMGNPRMTAGEPELIALSIYLKTPIQVTSRHIPTPQIVKDYNTNYPTDKPIYVFFSSGHYETHIPVEK